MYECDTGYEFTDAAATADGAAAALAQGRNVSCEEMADGSGGAEWSNPHGVPGDCWSKLQQFHHFLELFNFDIKAYFHIKEYMYNNVRIG